MKYTWEHAGDNHAREHSLFGDPNQLPVADQLRFDQKRREYREQFEREFESQIKHAVSSKLGTTNWSWDDVAERAVVEHYPSYRVFKFDGKELVRQDKGFFL